MLRHVRRWFKQFFCQHDPVFIRNIYGDEIITMGYKRSMWGCRKCGALLLKGKLHQEPEKKDPIKMDNKINVPLNDQVKKFHTVARRNEIRSLIATFCEINDAPYIRAIVGHPGLSLAPWPANLQTEKNSLRLGHRMFDTVVLSISPEAVRDYSEDNDSISFKCRFGGKLTTVVVTYDAIVSVGGSMTGVFQNLEIDPSSPLLLSVFAELDQIKAKEGSVQIQPAAEQTSASETQPDSPTPAKGRPSLRVVK